MDEGPDEPDQRDGRADHPEPGGILDLAQHYRQDRSCQHQQRIPGPRQGPARLLRRSRQPFAADVDAGEATRINTVKRALMTVPFDRRAALLLRDMAKLTYREMARALECSPEAASRLLAGARRDFGTVYREIAL